MVNSTDQKLMPSSSLFKKPSLVSCCTGQTAAAKGEVKLEVFERESMPGQDERVRPSTNGMEVPDEPWTNPFRAPPITLTFGSPSLSATVRVNEGI